MKQVAVCGAALFVALTSVHAGDDRYYDAKAERALKGSANASSTPVASIEILFEDYLKSRIELQKFLAELDQRSLTDSISKIQVSVSARRDNLTDAEKLKILDVQSALQSRILAHNNSLISKTNWGRGVGAVVGGVAGLGAAVGLQRAGMFRGSSDFVPAILMLGGLTTGGAFAGAAIGDYGLAALNPLIAPANLLPLLEMEEPTKLTKIDEVIDGYVAGSVTAGQAAKYIFGDRDGFEVRFAAAKALLSKSMPTIKDEATAIKVYQLRAAIEREVAKSNQLIIQKNLKNARVAATVTIAAGTATVFLISSIKASGGFGNIRWGEGLLWTAVIGAPISTALGTLIVAPLTTLYTVDPVSAETKFDF